MTLNLQANNNHGASVTALRTYLTTAGLDVWLQPVADEFQGEYPAGYAKRLYHVSGFTGSAGMGAFWSNTSKRDGLFVDGRYTIQAAQEVDETQTDILLTPPASFVDWLKIYAHASPVVVGFDAWLHTAAQVRRWQKETHSASITWRASANAISAVWQDAPAIPAEPIERYPDSLAGKSAADKIAAVIHALQADAVLLTQPDSICWLLNLRGSDIPYNPLVLGYLLIQKNGKHVWYMKPRMLGAEITEYLAGLHVQIADIEDFWRAAETHIAGVKTLQLDADHAPYALWLAAEKVGVAITESQDPTLLPKACKTPQEIDAITDAHVRDGAALSECLHHISTAKTMDELGAMEAVEAARRTRNDYRGASFATIAGSGPNGAIVHYHASEASNRTWNDGELLLLDSGGQYLGGTTDVTRVLVKGKPTDEMKDRYTRVLKGHIALATAQFPKGTTGAHLDTLARQFLWEIGCDYDHGTGHGIGAYLCVHEGPQSISKRGIATPLEAGMIVSNEPGYYKAGAYGIRIESVLCVVSHGLSADGREMLGFETLTRVPIETKLVDVALLTSKERSWLNDYHAEVYEALLPIIDSSAKAWLKAACAKI